MQKSYIIVFQSLIFRFSLTLVFPSGENTWIKTFFIKFEDNIEYIRGEAENISILPENLMKKHRNPRIFLVGKGKKK